jgi:MFS family permease
MFCGMFLSTVGASMIWPFLMLYVSEKLQVPLVVAGGLSTLNATMGVISSFIGGPITDKIGRKGVMIFSLIANGLAYGAMGQANSLAAFAVLMSITGTVNPLYRVGGDAMMADLVPPDRRPDAYALLRLSNNVGVAIGPAVGGVLATASYSIAFYCAAVGMIAYGLLLTLFARETLPAEAVRSRADAWGGYDRVARDRNFMPFVGAMIMTQMCATLMWILMAVYAKENYGVPENQYGLIPTTNALMVVFFQVGVTQITKRFPPLKMLMVGAIFYAIGVGSVSLARGFGGFWISMVIMTMGELILMPTSSSFAANLAPPDMRGRYMSIYGLTWPAAAGIAPVMGGWLNDTFGPVTIWYGGAVAGTLATTWFILLHRRADRYATGKRPLDSPLLNIVGVGAGGSERVSAEHDRYLADAKLKQESKSK